MMRGQVVIGEELRRRLEEIRERIQSRLRTVLGPGAGMRGELEIGGGKLIEKARTRIDELTARIKERRVKVIPTVSEALAKWKPGVRIKEVVPEVPKLAVEEKKFQLRE